jgi:hypothetical protein
MKFFYLLFLVVGLLPINTVFGQKAYERPTYIDNIYNVQEITAETLMNWDMTGKGQLSAVNKQVYLAETQGSAGVLLTSPIKYGIDLVVSYDVMALRPGTVLVALLSLSNSGNGGLKFEDSYDANLKYIANSTNAYMIAFLNAPHHRSPFINRFPAKKNPLVEDDRSHMQPGLYYHIDVGREKDHIWLAIDGEKIIEAVDPDPLGEGHFSFRIRGTANETASCLIRNVKIYTR